MLFLKIDSKDADICENGGKSTRLSGQKRCFFRILRMSSPIKRSWVNSPRMREAIAAEYRPSSSPGSRLVLRMVGSRAIRRRLSRSYRQEVWKAPGSSVPRSSTISKSALRKRASACEAAEKSPLLNFALFYWSKIEMAVSYVTEKPRSVTRRAMHDDRKVLPRPAAPYSSRFS